MPPDRSLKITVRQLALPLPRVEGSTHASRVIPEPRWRLSESGMLTYVFFVASNDRAFPYLPELLQVAPAIVPLFPLPDRSFTAVPAPSLKLYAATRPDEPAVPSNEPRSSVAAAIARPRAIPTGLRSGVTPNDCGRTRRRYSSASGQSMPPGPGEAPSGVEPL